MSNNRGDILPESKHSLKQLLHEIRRVAKSREVLTEKKIKAIYQRLTDDLYKFLGKNYVKYADGDGRLYMAYLDEQNKRAKFLQEIVKNVDNITPELNKEINDLVNKTYSESYKGMVEAVKNANTSKEYAELLSHIEVNHDTMRRAMKNNISKLTLPPVLEKKRQETIYDIQRELNVGLMQGDRYDEMAKRITERVGVSESKAKNIVRTESHRNVEDGMMDGAKEIQNGLDGSDLIYAATWCTMKDERVRPNRRVKTKHGWKTTRSKNGANHVKMDGVTIKVGDKFELEPGVSAENPGNSGVARHDCGCRCFLSYDLMTVEEFAKATGRKVKESGGKYTIGDPAREIRREEEAIPYYEKIRLTDDVEKIAKASGMSVEDIRTIKNHVFFDKHIKYDGSLGLADVDYDMAVAWKRLTDGKPEKRDILLLQHELYESQVEKKYGLTLAEAHEKADAVYGWKAKLIEEMGEGCEEDGLL